MEISPEYDDIGDGAMHEYLLGRAEETGHSRYIADILKYPESAWITRCSGPERTRVVWPCRRAEHASRYLCDVSIKRE